MTRPALPLSSCDNLSAFQIYAIDVRVLRRLSDFPATAATKNPHPFPAYPRAWTQTYVHQALIRSFEVPPRTWAKPPHEVDFILQREDQIIPVEAQSAGNEPAASLKAYEKEYPSQTPIMVRLSPRNLSLEGKILSVPLFMADHLSRLLELALP